MLTVDRDQGPTYHSAHDTSARPGSSALRSLAQSLGVGVEALPGYRLTSWLGRGGFGEVWQATGPGGVPLALKFIHLGEDAAQAEARSLEVLRNVRHANLMGVCGAWYDHGVLCMAMELADRSVADRFVEVQNQGLPGIPRVELLEYMLDAARGLDHLNEARHTLHGKAGVAVQHRDVKPQNLLLIGGSVKVADFGLACLLENTVAAHTGRGTPAYAAPEFFRGQTSRHSDQYALAITYTQLRGGELPFKGNIAQIMAGHLLMPPDLSLLPAEEQPIVARALAKNPDQRWPNCRTFVRALVDCKPAAKPVPPTAPPAPSVPRPPRPVVRRSRGRKLAICFGLLALWNVVFWGIVWAVTLQGSNPEDGSAPPGPSEPRLSAPAKASPH